MEKLPLGVGFVLGGAGALYLSPSLPPPTKTYAVAGGVVALAIGSYLVWSELKSGGGVVGALGEAVFGKFDDVDEGDAAQQLPGVVPSLGVSGPDMLVVRILSPVDGGSVRRGSFESDYVVSFEVTNTGATRYRGKLVFTFDEDYLWDDEKHSREYDLNLAPGARIADELLAELGALTSLSDPEVTLTVTADGVELARLKYEVNS